MSKIISLTSDFGLRDAYVASMKGVMLQILPSLQFVDISHQIASQDIMEAAFVIRNAVPYFPEGTIHLVVVDPGVGTNRKAVALQQNNHFFVGPDNGLLSLYLKANQAEKIVELDNPKYWRVENPTPTFHGRDIFAPVAAHIAAGVPLEALGSPLDTLSTMHWALPIADSQGIQGWVVHIDKFGNCITNIHQSLLEKYQENRSIKAYISASILSGIQSVYADVPYQESLLVVGSEGYLEVAINGGSASFALDIQKGNPINLVFNEPKS